MRHSTYHGPKVLHQFFRAESRRLFTLAATRLEKYLGDLLADIVPSALPIFAEKVTFPAMSDLIRICNNRVK